MIVSPIVQPIFKMRMTRHKFTNGILVNTSQTDIAWWNPSDHTEPFPWPCNETDRHDTPGYERFQSDVLRDFIDSFGINFIDQNVAEQRTHTGSYTEQLALMAVDAAGADLFDFFDPAPGNRAQWINGIYLKQTVTGSLSLTRDFRHFLIPWKFANLQGLLIPPL